MGTEEVYSKESTNEQQTFIVGVGASAGGLEALTKLVGNLNPKNKHFAILIAQHLSPDHKSRMVELLERNSKWPVQEAGNDEEIKLGHIYFCPSDHEIFILGRTIKLNKEHHPSGAKPSIDDFFESIAREEGGRSIGILLSGTGNDGTKGFEKIKDAGGYTVVQDPDQAAHKQMITSAIHAGVVDRQAKAEDIGNVVEQYALNFYAISKDRSQRKKKITGLDKILRLLAYKTGTDFSRYKPSTIGRRVQKRLDALSFSDVEKYYHHVRENPAELDNLHQTVLIGVTEFYRDPNAFDKLRIYLDRIVKRKNPKDSIRVWSVGCATGEEPYTLAIILRELLGEKANEITVQIFATDIDEQALTAGRRGLFRKEVLEGMDQEFIDKNFNKEGDKYEVKKLIRQMVLFSKHDITVDPPFVRLDLITCRNVLIYFNDELQREAMSLFHYALAENGYLMLGKSESISQLTDLFTTYEKKEKIFGKKSDVQINTLNFSNFRKAKVSRESLTPHVDPQMSLQEIAQETLVHTFEFPYLLLDESMEIVCIKGRMQPYTDLSDGSLNASAMKVLHKDLHMELRAVFNKTVKNKETYKTKVIRFSSMDKEILVRLTAKPLIYPKNEKDYFMVIFEEIDPEARYPFAIDSLEQDEHKNAIRVIELEQELEATKEHLQTFTEELETSNEELQSLNEELQSTNEELKSSNEELETSNEELQSANEELQTANTELGLSNESLIEKEAQLTKAKKDLEFTRERFEVALENSNIFIAYQDKELKYQWVHNKAPDWKNTDIIGRSDKELIPESDDVIKLKKEVLREGHAKNKIIYSRGQYWDTIVRPNIENGKIIGIRTVSIDVTEQVKTQKVISQQQSIIRSIVGENEENILALNKDFRVLVINASMKQLFYELFKKEVKNEDDVRSLLQQFPDKNADTIHLLENAFNGISASVENHPSLHTNKRGNPRYFDYRTFPLRDNKGEIIGAAIACTEVTDRVNMALHVQNIFQRSANLTGEEFFKDMTGQLATLFRVKYVFVGLLDQVKQEINTSALRVNGNLSENFSYALPNSPCERVSANEDEKYIENVKEKFPDDPKLQQWNAQSYRGLPITSPSTGEITAILVMIDDKSLVEPPQSDYILRIMTLRAGAELERQRNEEKLRHKDIQLKRVTDNLPEIIYEYEVVQENTRKGSFSYLSSAANTILEIPVAEILKDTDKFWGAIHPEDVNGLRKTLSDSMGKSKQVNWEGRVIGDRTGDIKWIKVISNPGVYEDGAVQKWHGIIEDITHLKNIQIDLLQAKDKADIAAKAKDEFLATMSHEMRTPLNAIVGITNLLLKENKYEELDQNLQALKFSSENLMYLINDILDYSKLEAGKAKVDLGLFHLKQLLKGLKQAHQLAAREKNLQFTVNYQELPDIVYGDQMKLSQVLNNLLSNAIKFTSSGEISLSVDVPESNDNDFFIRFIVKDTGIGIPADQQNFIFEKFNQGNHSKPNVRGTGLGLSITKMLLNLMNSSVTVQSVPGKGSEFSFTLPLRKPKTNQKNGEGQKLDLEKTSEPLELNILVVEDVEINRMVLLQYMKKLWGFKADEAENGKQALQMVKENDYDVILMDVRMPIMNGFECSASIREMGGRFETLPIIALTADSNSKLQGMENGHFTDVLFKPYEPEDLYRKLMKWGKTKKDTI